MHQCVKLINDLQKKYYFTSNLSCFYANKFFYNLLSICYKEIINEKKKLYNDAHKIPALKKYTNNKEYMLINDIIRKGIKNNFDKNIIIDKLIFKAFKAKFNPNYILDDLLTDKKCENKFQKYIKKCKDLFIK
jgi:hypothetical protein